MLRSPTALLVYAARAVSGGGHAHPWYYYLQTLTPAGDILWLPALLFLARRNRTVTFLGAYAVGADRVYSALPYKTPWCAAGMVHGWILTAAAGLTRFSEPRWRRAAAAGAVLVAVQAVRYAFPLAAEPRNPYAYVHTTRDVYAIRDRLGSRGLRSRGIDIVTGENWWPLPWYLRRYSQVRWWSAPPRAGRVGPILLCSPANEDAVARLLYELPPPGERELYVVPVFPDRLATPRGRSPRLCRGQRCAAERAVNLRGGGIQQFHQLRGIAGMHFHTRPANADGSDGLPCRAEDRNAETADAEIDFLVVERVALACG